MANATSLATSFKVELMLALHCLGTGGARSTDTIKAALYLQGGSIGAATTAYSSSGEVSGTGYTAGGLTVTNAVAPTSSGTTAYWTPSANVNYTPVTLSSSFDCVLLYNSTQSNRAIGSFTFPATTVAAGTYTLTMPSNGATTALLRFN